MKFHNRTDNTSYVFVLISVSMQRERDELVDGPYRRDFLTYDNHILDGDIFLQALNGFLMILDCNGELFFATHTIETYLGFHQSDVIHQSVYELVHSEDREELQRQLGMCKKTFEKVACFFFCGFCAGCYKTSDFCNCCSYSFISVHRVVCLCTQKSSF